MPSTKLSPVIRVDHPLGILSVSMAGEDHAAVRQAAAGMSCRIQTCETCRGALELLRRGGISIVVCECDLPDGTWRDILDRLDPSAI